MLQFFKKDGSFIDSIETHGFNGFRVGDVNIFTIEGNPEKYLASICWFFMAGKCIGSGIVNAYEHKKNENRATLKVFPLVIDMQTGFVENREYKGDVADILEEIITQYRASTNHPTVFLKEKIKVGKKIKHTFANQTFLQAYQFLTDRILRGNASVSVEVDGGIIIKNTSKNHNLTYKNDVRKIEYSKDISMLVNSIHFVSTNGNINIVVEDTDSISRYGRRVFSVSDDRFNHESSAREYCENILEKKSKPKIKVKAIETDRDDIKIGDTVSISNWEKNFDDALFVNKITFQTNGMYSIDIGSKETRGEMIGN